MPTGHSYIFFLSGIHTGCDFSSHGTHFRNHRMQACSYSMRRLWIPAFLFCVPDAHSVSGYPVFSTDAVSVFSFRISFPAFPDTRIRLHLHGSLLHFLRSHLQFINHPSEKDRMYRTLGRIRRFQREHSSAQSLGKLINFFPRIVPSGRMMVQTASVLMPRSTLQMWRKRDIQKRCGQQAHRKGIRISRICAWNTSMLSFDGSGEIARDTRDHRLCTFQTGKRYNCDLSASYNIGARYFIRELLKSLPVTERSLLEAKVPPVKRRTSCVYADLKELHLQMEILKAA